MTFELGVLLTVLAQTVTIAWWASGINTLVHQHDKAIEKLEAAVEQKSSDPEGSAAGRQLLQRIERLEAVVR